MDTSDDYREGFGLGVEHKAGNYAVKLPEDRSRDYYRGYEAAATPDDPDAIIAAWERWVEAHPGSTFEDAVWETADDYRLRAWNRAIRRAFALGITDHERLYAAQ